MDFTSFTTYDSGPIIVGFLAAGGILAGIKWGRVAVMYVLDIISKR